MTESTKAKDIVFDSQNVSRLAVQEIKRRRANSLDGIKTMVPLLDEDLTPLRTGELIVVLGYTSNYKSGLMQFISRKAIPQLSDHKDAIVIYATWEQSVEEHGMMELAATSRIDASKLIQGDLTTDEWKRMMKAAVDRAISPLWLVGHSSQAGKRRPRLSMEDINKALAYIVDERGKVPALVCLDYAQRIRPDKNGPRREQVMAIVDQAKDLALSFSCPVIIGTQSGRQVLERKWKLPQISDGQETSNLEQSADKFISLWMPKTSEPPDSMVGVPAIPVTDNLLYVGLLKQKFGPAPRIYALHVEPAINEIYAMDRRDPNPAYHARMGEVVE